MLQETFPSAPPQKQEVFSRDEKIFLNEKLQAMHDGALLEEDFAIFTDSHGIEYGLYQKKEIENDRAEVAAIKKNFEINDKIRQLEGNNYEAQLKIMETSRYLEALFYEKLGGKDGWIPGSTVYKTSEYDDFKNHLDFVIELEDEHIGVAIDVTLSRRAEIIIGKLKKAKQLIDRNRLAEIKYYERPDDVESGQVPLAVIALDYDHAVQALKFWADGDDELLSRHPTRVKAWLETSAQFDAYRTYATRQHKNDVAAVYSRAYDVMQKIINDNILEVDKYRTAIENDQAYQAILGFCEDLKEGRN